MKSKVLLISLAPHIFRYIFFKLMSYCLEDCANIFQLTLMSYSRGIFVPFYGFSIFMGKCVTNNTQIVFFLKFELFCPLAILNRDFYVSHTLGL